MNMLLAGALAGVLSNTALAQAPDLKGPWITGDGGSYYLCTNGVCNAYPLPHLTDNLLPPTTYDYPEKGVCFPDPCRGGDRGTEGRAPGEVTVLRGSR